MTFALNIVVACWGREVLRCDIHNAVIEHIEDVDTRQTSPCVPSPRARNGAQQGFAIANRFVFCSRVEIFMGESC